MAELYDNIGLSIADGISTILYNCMADIQAEMAAKDINASGRTSKSFRVERYDGGIRLIMGGTAERTAPLATLEVGRPGGNVPGGFRTTKAGVRDVSNTFKAILVQWAKDKGIDNFGWGAATMLGRKIAREGTERHKNPVNVYTDPVLRAKQEIQKYAQATVTELVHRQLSTLKIA